MRRGTLFAAKEDAKQKSHILPLEEYGPPLNYPPEWKIAEAKKVM
jgi:hypothetical protein